MGDVGISRGRDKVLRLTEHMIDTEWPHKPIGTEWVIGGLIAILILTAVAVSFQSTAQVPFDRSVWDHEGARFVSRRYRMHASVCERLRQLQIGGHGIQAVVKLLGEPDGSAPNPPKQPTRFTYVLGDEPQFPIRFQTLRYWGSADHCELSIWFDSGGRIQKYSVELN